MRRRAEQAPILPVELRGAFVADTVAGGGGIEQVDEHQPARFLQTQRLLILQRAHRGQRLEVLVQRGLAHGHRGRQFVDGHRTLEVLVDPVNGAGDPMRLTALDRRVAQAAALVAAEQEIQDFLLDQRRQNRNVLRTFDQARQTQHGILQARRQDADAEAARRAGDRRERGRHPVHQFGDFQRIEVERQAQVGLFRRGGDHLPDQRQTDRGDQVVLRVIHIRLVRQGNALGALGGGGENRFDHRAGRRIGRRHAEKCQPRHRRGKHAVFGAMACDQGRELRMSGAGRRGERREGRRGGLRHGFSMILTMVQLNA